MEICGSWGAKSHAKWLMPTIDADEPLWLSYTVDGSEIWRSPVEVGSFTHYLQSCYIPGDAGFLAWTVAAFACLWLPDFVVHGCFCHMVFFQAEKGGHWHFNNKRRHWIKVMGGFPKFKEFHMNLKWNNGRICLGPLVVTILRCSSWKDSECFCSHVSPWPSLRYFHLNLAELFPQTKVPVDYLNSVWDRIVLKNHYALNQVVGITFKMSERLVFAFFFLDWRFGICKRVMHIRLWKALKFCKWNLSWRQKRGIIWDYHILPSMNIITQEDMNSGSLMQPWFHGMSQGFWSPLMWLVSTESSECGQVSSVYFNKIRFARAPLDQLLNCFRIKKGGEHIYIYIYIWKCAWLMMGFMILITCDNRHSYVSRKAFTYWQTMCNHNVLSQ